MSVVASSHTIPTVERVQVKPSLRHRLPEPDIRAVLGPIPGNRCIIRDGQTLLSTGPDSTVRVGDILDMTVETDRIGDVDTRDLPGAFSVEPWVGGFELLALA